MWESTQKQTGEDARVRARERVSRDLAYFSNTEPLRIYTPSPDGIGRAPAGEVPSYQASVIYWS